MKRLILLRHAKAEKEGPRGGGDAARPLAPRGVADAGALGRTLALAATRIDAIVASPARRALETARLVARELDYPWDAIRVEPAAYLADPDTLLRLVQDRGEDAQCLLLVGHNPGITELAHLLARRFAEELPTCGAVAIDCAVDTWGGVRPGCGSLRWYEPPASRR